MIQEPRLWPLIERRAGETPDARFAIDERDRAMSFAQYRDAAERLCAEGRKSGRMLTLGIRPWLLGMPHRIRYLDEALAAVLAMDGVWSATAGDIADAFDRQALTAEGEPSP